jgi:hypothetical protein
MNFLALIGLKQETAPKVTATLVACPTYDEPVECQQRPLARPTGHIIAEQRSATQAAPKKLWNESKRIQRLRALAQLSARGNSQIEGVKINGVHAKMMLKMYDGLTEEAQHRFVALPMQEVFEYFTASC